MTEDNVIEVTNITKSFRIYHERASTLYEHLTGIVSKKHNYENLKVLDNISFNVRKGEMLGIIGKNGEGKTTLLRLLTRIFKPDSGIIKINGSVIPFLELGSGFQPELTAVDNVTIYGMLLGFTKKQIKEKIPSILEYAELEKFADTKLKHFSSGMYARLAFSTAIQVNPDILLVDEVLSVGDASFQEKSFQTFLSFKKRGKTIIFVSHNLQQIARLCDRAIFLNGGRIYAVGKPNEVINCFYRHVENKMQTSNEEIISLTRRFGPQGIALNHLTDKIFVANLAADLISVIDGKSKEIVKNIHVSAAPRDLAINERTNILYVVNRDSNSVTVIDVLDNRILSTIPVGERPRGIRINSESNIIYVSNRDSKSISVIDGNDNEVISTIPVNGNPTGIDLDKKTNKVYVSLTESNSICVIDGNYNKVLSVIPVGESPVSIVIDEKTRLMYITNRNDNDLSVLDIDNGILSTRIQVQSSPFGASFNPNTGYLYVTNSGSNTVSKINCRTKKPANVISVGNFPLGLAVNLYTNSIYVVNESDDTVSVIDGENDEVSYTIKLLTRKDSENTTNV